MPLTYFRRQWSLLLDNGMSLASLGPIDEKWLLNAFGKWNDSDIEVPLRFITLIDELMALQDVRSLVICHVLHGSPLGLINSLLHKIIL